ncbi:MAG: M13-type metalloendopeptidase [Porticoccaceae bacterium]
MRVLDTLLFAFILLVGCGKPLAAPVSGVDRTGMNPKIQPGDDFFAYANGKWLAETEIPADRSTWGSFPILQEQTLLQLRDIAAAAARESSPQDSAHARIGAFYSAFMNENLVAERGLTPLKEELSTIAALTDHQAIAAYFGHAGVLGVGSPLELGVNQDDKDATHYILYLDQGGLGLPDRDYYFDTSEHGLALLAKYRDFMSKLLALAGEPAPETAAARVIALESRIAEHQWSRVDNRDAEKTYNRRTDAELKQSLANYNLDGFLHAQGITTIAAAVVRQPSYVSALDALFRDTAPDVWRDYLRARLLIAYAPYLPPAYADLHFDFYNRTLSGQAQPQERWKRAIDNLNAHLGEQLGKLYVEQHFPPEAKVRMEQLVGHLLDAYRVSIGELSWMSAETRARALKKLDQFTPKIGYPDRWRDFTGLELRSDDLIGNIQRTNAFNHAYEVAKLGRPVDRHEWFMPPQQINAYYNPGLNEIVFPAAILQPPFFNLAADDAVNYGAIGAVIGHEIGHGFDDQGSKYDGDGNLNNWWTPEDRANFEARTKVLVTQYGQYEALPGRKVNGELSLGENIGDLGGVGIAVRAYRMALAGQAAPVIDGFSGEQRLFLGWAQAWRIKRRDQLAEQLLRVDPHSPPEFRVNGVVRNIDAFYDAFDVRPGARLYLPPAERVKIW